MVDTASPAGVCCDDIRAKGLTEAFIVLNVKHLIFTIV